MAPAWHNLPHAKIPLEHRVTIAGLYVADVEVVAWIYRENDGIYVGEVELEGRPISQHGYAACDEDGAPVMASATVKDPEPWNKDQVSADVAFLRSVERDVNSLYAEEADKALREAEDGWRAAA
ncbi:hypothetical protein [Antarcticirhabdus aurantiaca]|uniref:Uncharacterized protein n=1 Tax=Antarcticirhabdus aurantiaca TaxID=2606717 RepID=A0ACD4NJZ5_9HYPH|nr:hypothetical protein [Antarcticirhabdus aurantiaca]WAJ27149.1 hypothetical protein OXU80_20165 [Jeongeuplla avenae]